MVNNKVVSNGVEWKDKAYHSIIWKFNEGMNLEGMI